MLKLIRIAALFALLFNAVGALAGGAMLMLKPDGSSMGLPLNLLHHTIFHNYFIPGLVLFIVNGLLSLYVLLMALLEKKHYTEWIFAQGALLTGWILVQMMIIGMVYYLHGIMGLTGVFLMVAGGLLYAAKTRIAGTS